MSVPLINPDEEFRRYRRRLEIAAGFAVVAFLGLLTRFVWLQVAQFDRYQTLAESNRISLVPAVPPRGVIYDRQGKLLAQNFSAYTLEITPEKVADINQTIAELAKLITIEPGDRKRFRKQLTESKNFESIPIRNLLTEEEAARFAVNRYRFPGVEINARLFRQYPFGASLSHVIGYIGRIGERDLESIDKAGHAANYKGTDHIGKLGIEASYEAFLHGRTGIEKVETDSGGQAVRVLSRTPPVAGHNLWLSLDAKMQQIADQVFGDFNGALVALDPRDGGVLALVSKPGFDPNLFVDGIDTDSWRALSDSPDRPLINRALRGIYPPGSTIKPFMALAGLQLGVRKPEESIADAGYFTLPGSSHRYRDWKVEGHGMVNARKAITQSCDTYFYGLANKMGIERMSGFLGQFGFGHKSGVDLDGELSGLMPTPAWKQRRFKQPWWPGETVVAGIGQGYVLTTPMQLAVATMAIANHGVVYKPQLIRSWQNPANGQVSQAAPQPLGRIDLKPEYLQLVREAMIDVTKPGGTAAMAGANTPYLFAGKTGTAQVIGIKQGARYDESKVARRHRDHALFVAFAPADAPKIAIAVMVENGGHGGSTAAPIARKVIDYWLLGKLPDKPVSEEPVDASDSDAAHPDEAPANGD